MEEVRAMRNNIASLYIMEDIRATCNSIALIQFKNAIKNCFYLIFCSATLPSCQKKLRIFSLLINQCFRNMMVGRNKIIRSINNYKGCFLSIPRSLVRMPLGFPWSISLSVDNFSCPTFQALGVFWSIFQQTF